MRIAVLASGTGSNFEAIMIAKREGVVTDDICLLFSDQKQALVLEKAKKYGVPSVSFSLHDFSSKELYEKKLRDLLVSKKIDFVVLAGYMKILGSVMLETYANRIINIHPSLLPSFPGRHGIKDAFTYGVKVTGVTIHYVDDGVDTGPIIAQKAVEINPYDTLETLEIKIHSTEHALYPQVIAKLTKNENKKENF